MVIAGVMSGSSLDGLDIAVMQFNSDQDWQLLWTYDLPYSEEWVQRLRSYAQLSAKEYIALKSDYSRYAASLVSDALSQYAGKVDYISFHGHTLMHLPDQGITEQIGNGGSMAAVLNIPILTDFRTQDVTKGGVGTPLAPLSELYLFSGHEYYLNLGGIANLTQITNSEVVAYDVCPFNQVLNHYSQQLGKEYDEDGIFARRGNHISQLAEYFNTIPYFSIDPPKSLDNNWIVNEVIPNIPEGEASDLLHSYCHWAAKCIANQLNTKDTGSTMMVTGGGAKNLFFIGCLKQELSVKGCDLHVPEEEIIDFKEAMLMALLAYKYLKDEVNVLKDVTGATSDSIGGALYKV